MEAMALSYPGEVAYMYKGFTRPEYRGAKLHGAIMGRAGARTVVWDRPELRALCPPDALAYDAADPVLFALHHREQNAVGLLDR